MKDVHEYIDGKGTKWNRVFLAPTASIDTKIDCDSFSDFSRKTENKNMKLGDMWDLSGELSDKRIKRKGHDPIKENAIKNYSKKCKGKPHPQAYEN
jgi:hypothetical protein